MVDWLVGTAQHFPVDESMVQGNKAPQKPARPENPGGKCGQFHTFLREGTPLPHKRPILPTC